MSERCASGKIRSSYGEEAICQSAWPEKETECVADPLQLTLIVETATD